MKNILFGAMFTISANTIHAEEELWQYETSLERSKKREGRSMGVLWIPAKCEYVRGLIFAQKTRLEEHLVADPIIRQTAADLDLGILYFEPSFDILFNYKEEGADKKLQEALTDLAKKSGHPELISALLLTIGHSTGGIFARNVAYWNPDRVLGVIHLKSGNLQHGIFEASRSLSGVPFLAINGEFEVYGPEGGIREKYARQTQWVMIRMQMLWLRARNPNHLMSLLVEPEGGHSSWSEELSRYCALFIRKAVEYRLPKEKPEKVFVKCRPLRTEDGWLTDANIKAPQHKPAKNADYAGDKNKAFWHFDREMVEATVEIHKRLKTPDPSLDEQWWVPPSILIPKYTWVSFS